jgi:predicted kinase
VYAKDYKEEAYEGLQEEAGDWVRRELERVVGEGERDVVLDLALWDRRQRDGWREVVAEKGRGRYGVVLVVLKGREEVLWERIRGRERGWVKRGIMGAGRPVSRELLGQFLKGFEWPEGEGEIVVDVV